MEIVWVVVCSRNKVWWWNDSMLIYCVFRFSCGGIVGVVRGGYGKIEVRMGRIGFIWKSVVVIFGRKFSIMLVGS